MLYVLYYLLKWGSKFFCWTFILSKTKQNSVFIQGRATACCSGYIQYTATVLAK